ncbi:murein biosynthesis integral membrane protein MurJ [Gammaproteobacteria bacterium]|nr:murein biosynthesis integral membrane protein MurJ [Gammaproteobacteria bacterium]
MANTQSNKIFKALTQVSAWTGLSRVFGLIRDVATTSLLGASVFHDIFVVTLKIPNLFRRFFAEGAFNQAFIPIYSDYQKNKNEKDIYSFLNALAGSFLSVLFFFTILVLLIAPIFIFIFAPGFYFDDYKKELAVDILRIMFPYLALISLVAFSSGIQNSHDRFSLPAFTPLIFNLSLIIAAVYIAPRFNIPVYALAWGVLVAGFLQLIIHLIELKKINRLPRPNLNWSHPGLRNFLDLIFPAILAGGIIQINLLVDTIFASLLETGSPTWLYVSDRLIQFPMGIFAIAIGTVLLPTLSKIDINNNKDLFISELQKGQRFVLFIGLPSFIGLYLCSIDLISTIFFRGEFTSYDVQQSSMSLMAFSIGLPFFMLMKVLTPAFFARKDSKTPMYVALMSLILNALLNYFLAFELGLGHIGIAIGSSIAAIVSVLMLELILVKRGLINISNPFNKFNFSILIPSLLVVIFLHYFAQFFDFFELNEIERVMILLFKVATSALIYFIISRIIRGYSLREFLN